MYAYIVKRVLLMIPTLFGAAVLVFFLLRLLPGDVCEVRLAGTGLYADPRDIALCREELGLDDPLATQFVDFVGGYLTGDLGKSMWTGQPIEYEIGLRFKLSLQLAIMATLVAVAFAIPLGIISAVKQDTWIDYAVRTFSIAGIAIPSFWLGIMIILGLLIVTQKLFGAGWMPPINYVSPFEDPLGNLAQLIWPAVATGYRYSAVATRMTRSAMLEVLREDYVRTARAKGLVEKLIINRHALKNALLPVVTIIAIEFAFLIGGLVVTEQVFNLNGLGKLFVDAVGNQDFALTQQLVMLVVLIFVLTNLVIDILYAWLDPRIRYA
ncbi:MAG: ABC transporter permease [Gammaproteobacteria bacterium]|nr:ABC transporter permease [Gammaproteobacteria bacterium]